MLLEHHVTYSLTVVDELNLQGKMREQIKIGATVNDLCEFTNEGQIFFPSKDAIHKSVGTRRGIFDNSALYQSHFGNLASLHAMSKKPGEEAAITKNEIGNWFEFLNDVALGNITIVPDQVIATDNVQIQNMFAGVKIKYEQIFDANETLKIKHRAIGMMLHLIQDAYTSSHCERNEKNEVVKFYCYALQDKAKHKAGDDVPDMHRSSLLAHCKDCVESILSGQKYGCGDILLLSSNVQASDGGAYI
jgi:hypothetical protein